MSKPEKLSLWDRMFNRERREIMEEGKEAWVKITLAGSHDITRSFVKYKIIDRVTGSETIEKVNFS